MAEFDPASKETKVLRALIDAVDEMAQTVNELVEANSQMCDVIESLDDDLIDILVSCMAKTTRMITTTMRTRTTRKMSMK